MVVKVNALLLQVERLEMRVVAPLKAYGDKVKNKRVSLYRCGLSKLIYLQEANVTYSGLNVR